MFQKVFQTMTTNNIYYKKINVHVPYEKLKQFHYIITAYPA